MFRHLKLFFCFDHSENKKSASIILPAFGVKGMPSRFLATKRLLGAKPRVALRATRLLCLLGSTAMNAIPELAPAKQLLHALPVHVLRHCRKAGIHNILTWCCLRFQAWVFYHHWPSCLGMEQQQARFRLKSILHMLAHHAPIVAGIIPFVDDPLFLSQ